MGKTRLRSLASAMMEFGRALSTNLAAGLMVAPGETRSRNLTPCPRRAITGPFAPADTVLAGHMPTPSRPGHRGRSAAVLGFPS
jgi:hypothetical protein